MVKTLKRTASNNNVAVKRIESLSEFNSTNLHQSSSNSELDELRDILGWED